MCLQWLADTDLASKTVYDYGCGSGILGIAAALLGAKHIWQTDIDPQALTASRDNAGKNGVADKISIAENPDSAPQVDILVANILLEPLCFLKPQFIRHITPQSTLLFAGLLERQIADINAVYAQDFDISVKNIREGWVLLQLSPK